MSDKKSCIDKVKCFYVIVFLSLLLCVSCSSVPTERKVDNIIFCIGDGMGLGQVAFARMKSAGLDGKLQTEQMPVTGIMRTHSADSAVTDSAASGTAMACGFKTNNGMVNVLPDGEQCVTILEAAKDIQMSTGLVATSAITHATPACFASHVKSRGMETKIAEQLIENKVNVMFGGGRHFFLPRTDKNSKRTDDRNLIDEAKKVGYCYIKTAKELDCVSGSYVLGLFQLDALTTKQPEPSLAELTKKAVEILSKDKKGFFLMVEGSQIDWACHGNDPDYCLRETLLFDEAVGKAMEFAKADKHTLVIVTADHETGGLVINGSDMECKKLKLNWSTKGHTASPLVVYAYGPGAEMFTGVYDNTELPKKLAKLLGIKTFPRLIK